MSDTQRTIALHKYLDAKARYNTALYWANYDRLYGNAEDYRYSMYGVELARKEALEWHFRYQRVKRRTNHA
jgi:hypothetical protein